MAPTEEDAAYSVPAEERSAASRNTVERPLRVTAPSPGTGPSVRGARKLTVMDDIEWNSPRPGSSLRDREGSGQGRGPALEQHGHPVTRLDALGGALEVLHGPDALPVHLAHHVAPLQPRLGRRALFFHPRHDDAVRGAKVELPLEVRGDR